MKNPGKNLICFLFIVMLTSFFIYSSEVPQWMKDWLLNHPEFYNGNFYYVDKDTNKVNEKDKWYYYDIKENKMKAMPGDLKTALIGELITAYDKIDKCSALDKYRDVIDKRRKETKYSFMFDSGLDIDTFAKCNHGDWNPSNNTLTIRLNTDFVNNFLGYLPGSTPGTLYMKDRNTVDGYHVPLNSTIGHELLHLWLDITGSEQGECTVWSLEKKCLDPKTTIPDQFKCKCKEYTWSDCKENRPPINSENNGGETLFKKSVEHADNGDDNFSSASGTVSSLYLTSTMDEDLLPPDKDFLSLGYFPDILVYNKFNYPDMPNLLDKFKGVSYINDFKHDYFSNNHKVLVIPSGEFMGDAGSEIIQQALKKFVEAGGVILCLAQQYDVDWHLLPASVGARVSGPGWRQDQSCYSGSCYPDQMHPALGSLSSTAALGNAISINTDGYFIDYPDNSTVLLRRTKNRYPLMLYYPYVSETGTIGGGVLVCSLFTDWGASHGQASTTELRLIQDLLTFAKNIHQPIPLYNLDDNSSPQVQLDIDVENTTETPATKIIMTAYTPGRNKVLYELEQSISLAPGEKAVIPLSFLLNGTDLGNYYGICHVDYVLYDAEGIPIQMIKESDGGRFAVYRPFPTQPPKKGYDIWITSSDENYYINEKAQITLHVKNYKQEPITLYWWYQWGHTGGETIPSLTVAPGEEKEYYLEAAFPQYMAELVEIQAFLNLRYKIDTEASYKTVQKGFLVKGTQTRSTLNFSSARQLAPGSALDYSLQSKYLSAPLPGNATVRLALEKFNRQTSKYDEIKTILEVQHDFKTNGEFRNNGTYTPGTLHPGGTYRLKLQVTDPNGIKEQERYQDFSYANSNFYVTPGSMGVTCLEPGGTYSIPIKIKNPDPLHHNYTVQNGTCVLVLKSSTGREVFRKEITGITIPPNQEQNLQETFIFNPVETGRYTLEYTYTDETRDNTGEPLYREDRHDFIEKFDPGGGIAVLDFREVAFGNPQGIGKFILLNDQGTAKLFNPFTEFFQESGVYF